MRSYSAEHNIDFIYEGFEKSLNEFENRISTLTQEYNKAIEENSIEGYNYINRKVLSKYLFKDHDFFLSI